MTIHFISPLPVLFPLPPVNLASFSHISMQSLSSGHLSQHFDVDRYIWVQLEYLTICFWYHVIRNSSDRASLLVFITSLPLLSLAFTSHLSTKGLIE
jgi:hypothetical protein